MKQKRLPQQGQSEDQDFDQLLAEIDEQAREMEEAMFSRLLEAALKEKKPNTRRKLKIVRRK